MPAAPGRLLSLFIAAGVPTSEFATRRSTCSWNAGLYSGPAFLGVGGFFIGLLVAEFCGVQVAHRVFGSSSPVGGLIVTCYSVGLFLWSTAWVLLFLSPRIRAPEEQIAALAREPRSRIG